jgi:hypothetical protein
MEVWFLMTAAIFLFLIGFAGKAKKIIKDFMSNQE